MHIWLYVIPVVVDSNSIISSMLTIVVFWDGLFDACCTFDGRSDGRFDGVFDGLFDGTFDGVVDAIVNGGDDDVVNGTLVDIDVWFGFFDE